MILMLGHVLSSQLDADFYRFAPLHPAPQPHPTREDISSAHQKLQLIVRCLPIPYLRLNEVVSRRATSIRRRIGAAKKSLPWTNSFADPARCSCQIANELARSFLPFLMGAVSGSAFRSSSSSAPAPTKS